MKNAIKKIWLSFFSSPDKKKEEEQQYHGQSRNKEKLQEKVRVGAKKAVEEYREALEKLAQYDKG